MASMDEFFRKGVPIIGYDIPPDEREAVSNIQGLLYQLEHHVENFRAALALFDFSINDEKTKMQWPFLAARDGAMTIFNFKTTLDEIRASLGSAPSLKQQIDINPLRLAYKLFESLFPVSRPMRIAVAHATLKDKPPRPGVTILHSLAGRRYTTDFNRKRLFYDLSTESLEKLELVKLRFFRGFDDVNILVRKPQPNSNSSEGS